MTFIYSSVGVLQLDFYLSGCILLPICVLGIICNSLVAVVLTNKSMRTSTNNFLLALAFFDSLLLLSTIFLICLPPLTEVYKRHVLPQIMPYMYPAALISQTCTIWITVCFTTERYIAVRYPLKATSMCTVRRARIICVTVALISVLYNMSRWLELQTEPETRANGTEPVWIPGTNITAYKLTHTKLGGSSLYEIIYFTALYIPFMSVVPTVALAVLNSFLIRTVHRSREERKRMGNSCSSVTKENNITIMLVSVVIVFIICQVMM